MTSRPPHWLWASIARWSRQSSGDAERGSAGAAHAAVQAPILACAGAARNGPAWGARNPCLSVVGLFARHARLYCRATLALGSVRTAAR